MKARRAEFVTSAVSAAGFPAPQAPEIAFAGRSNVGKSSLINTLVGVPALAVTSRTPGRTRMINWFAVDSAKGVSLAFVDLPGYGYAKVPRGMRDSWRPLIESYLQGRGVLRAVVCIIDARRGVQAEEEELMAWLRAEQVPCIPVLTKVDKLPKSKRKPAGVQAGRDLGIRSPVLFSAHTSDGVSDLWRAILSHVG